MLIIYPMLPFLCLALPKLDKETDKSMNPYIKWGGIVIGAGVVGATIVTLAEKIPKKYKDQYRQTSDIH